MIYGKNINADINVINKNNSIKGCLIFFHLNPKHKSNKDLCASPFFFRVIIRYIHKKTVNLYALLVFYHYILIKFSAYFFAYLRYFFKNRKNF